MIYATPFMFSIVEIDMLKRLLLEAARASTPARFRQAHVCTVHPERVQLADRNGTVIYTLLRRNAGRHALQEFRQAVRN